MGTDLHDMLEAREKRYQRQRRLLRRYPGALVCFTLNVPGSEKRSPELEAAHEEGFRALCGRFPSCRVLYSAIEHANTGDEAYLCLDCESIQVKQTTVFLERNHSCGRLFDIDVFDSGGGSMTRSALGLPPRTCFLCEQEAKVCIRNRTHTVEELRAAVSAILNRSRIGLPG